MFQTKYLFECELPDLLSDEELNAFFTNKDNINYQIREKIIISNIRLVKDILNKYFLNSVYYTYYKHLVSRADLLSVGILGLINSIDTFDISKNIKFSSYASVCIFNEVAKFLKGNRKYINMIHIDEKKENEINSLEKSYKSSSSYPSDFTEIYEREELYRKIRTIVLKLPSSHKYIMEKSFGFFDNKIEEQSQIAKHFNVKQPCISRKKKRILKKIKEELEEEDFI